jgi:hypothetical protein
LGGGGGGEALGGGGGEALGGGGGEALGGGGGEDTGPAGGTTQQRQGSGVWHHAATQRERAELPCRTVWLRWSAALNPVARLACAGAHPHRWPQIRRRRGRRCPGPRSPWPCQPEGSR